MSYALHGCYSSNSLRIQILFSTFHSAYEKQLCILRIQNAISSSSLSFPTLFFVLCLHVSQIFSNENIHGTCI